MTSLAHLLTSDGDDGANTGTVTTTVRSARPAPRGSAAYPRRRAVRACQTCRARRTKCDNAKPSCSFCLKVGARCIQSQADLSSFDPASLRILERLDELENVFRITAGSGGSTISTVQHPPNNASIDEEKRNLFPNTIEEILYWPCFQARLQEQRPQVYILSILRSPAGSSANSTLGSSPASIAADLEPRTMRCLLDNFFQHCHVKNPILTNEPAIRRMAVELCLHGVDWSAQSCLILLICALGTISTPFGPSGSTHPNSVAYSASWSYFKSAQKRLGSLMDTSGVIEAQCMFLAGVYCMCVFRISSAWRYFSQALACCQDFEFVLTGALEANDTGALEEQQGVSQYSRDEQVIYWSSWKSERETRGALQPHDFPLLEKSKSLYPPFFPTPPGMPPENEMDELQMDRQHRSWYFYLTEISLHRLASRKASEMMDLQPSQDSRLLESLISNVPDGESEIEEWARSLPLVMSLDTPCEQDDVAKFVIRGHLNNLYELLYWPFLVTYLDRMENDTLEQDNSDSDSGVARHATLAELSLCKHLERLQLNKPGFYHRHHGTWFMIRSCTRSALVLVRTALANQHALDNGDMRFCLALPDGWQQAVFDTLELNRYWAAEVPDAQDRLSRLEELYNWVQIS